MNLHQKSIFFSQVVNRIAIVENYRGTDPLNTLNVAMVTPTCSVQLLLLLTFGFFRVHSAGLLMRLLASCTIWLVGAPRRLPSRQLRNLRILLFRTDCTACKQRFLEVFYGSFDQDK